MIAKKYLICCLSLILVCASVSNAGLDAYLKLEGETQGSIDGDSVQPGHEGEIVVTGFSHEVIIPRDPNGKPATGRSHHEPVKISKRIDQSSPLLMNALNTSETFTVFSLTFMRMGVGLEDYYTVELTGAQIVGARQWKLNTLNPDNDWSGDMETIWFTYHSIQWTYHPNGGPIESQEVNWGYDQSRVLRISDLNHDGTVNMIDVAILADEWLAE
jgi:type VI secretion system secreted protein Hcp